MRYEFHPFALDVDTRQLQRQGRNIHLTPKAWDLLRILVERRPRAVSKAELHDSLWPETFVSEANLSVLITEVRSALKDPARRPRFIRTVHRYGYAFCGDVVVVQNEGRDSSRQVQVASCWLISATRQIPLSAGGNLVGRDPNASVWLDVPSVSRRHARIIVDDEHATVEDLDSKNGTWVRGQRIAATAHLRDREEIRFGSVTLTFRVWQAGVSTESDMNLENR